MAIILLSFNKIASMNHRLLSSKGNLAPKEVLSSKSVSDFSLAFWLLLVLVAAFSFVFLTGCGAGGHSNSVDDSLSAHADTNPNKPDVSDVNNPILDTISSTGDANDTLPPPYATPSVKDYCKVIGWPAGKTPIAPPGFTVTKIADNFADGFYNPRFIYVADNGDIFVSEANTEPKGIKKLGAKFSAAGKSQNLGQSANRISLLRMAPDGRIANKYTFKEGLNQPFGLLIIDNHFYIANTDGLLEFDYHSGDTVLVGKGKKILDLPAGGYNNHWTRNIITNDEKNKIFISVGSGSNIAEHGIENEVRRADILTVNPDGSHEKIYAYGLRNPAGLDIQPDSKVIWAAVNERDDLGDNLVPDYITSVKEGGFYGWPYSYFGNHPDPRMKASPHPELVKTAIVPDIPVGSHTASLGLRFYSGRSFPAHYHNGAFVGQHGSWNRSQLAGYKVCFVPFRGGKPSGKMEDFLTGFIANSEKREVYGRPVGIAVAKDGSLLVADDASNSIWRVSVSK